MRITPEIITNWANFILIIWAVIKMTKEAGSEISKPEAIQNERITKLELWRDEVNRRMEGDDKRISVLEQGNRVNARSLLAIMNSLESITPEDLREGLNKAKEELNNYLIEK